MKRNRFFTFTLLVIISFMQAFSQDYFSLTPTGFVAADGKDFIVIENNLKAEKKMKRLQQIINEIIVVDNDNKIILESNKIYFSSFELNLFRVKYGVMMEHIMDVDYSCCIHVKDDKYRIDAPKLKNIGVHRFQLESMVLIGKRKDYKNFKKNQFIFKESDKSVNNTKAKETIENYFNTLIHKIVLKMNSKEDLTEDW